MIQLNQKANLKNSQNKPDLDKQPSQLSISQYPSSLESSQLVTVTKRSRVEQMSGKQQQIVSNYLTSAQNKGLSQLLIEREKLLGELHSINSHLNQMIASVYGDFQTLPNQNSCRNNSLDSSSNPKQQQLLDKNQNKPNLQQQQKISVFSQQQLTVLQLKNQKLIQSLKNQLADFEFMLTGEYIERLDEQILKCQTIKKEFQYQVALIDKQIKKYTKAYDKQTIAKLQKSTYDAQIQLTLLSKKLQSRLLKLNSLTFQIKQKSNKIQTLSNQQSDLERLLQMYEDEQYQGEQTTRKKKQNYEKLLNKKQKIFKIINSFNNNHLKLYNKKLSDFRNIDQKISSLKETIKQMDYKIVLAAKDRKQFELQNKNILQSQKHFSSLINPSRKFTLKLEETSAQENKHFFTKKRLSEENSLSQRNRLKFLRIPESKQTSGSQLKKETLQKPKAQQNDFRRRIYTQLQNSHYFSSVQKNNSSKNIKTLQEVGNNIRKVKGEYEKNQLMNQIEKSSIFIPTTDKQNIGTVTNHDEKLNQLHDAKLNKLHQKKFNLSNTPINNGKKRMKDEGFSSHELSNKTSINEPSEYEKREKGIMHSKAKGLNRKGVSHEIEKGSEDQIQKRLIQLENLLKQGQTEQVSSQIQQLESRLQQQFTKQESKPHIKAERKLNQNQKNVHKFSNQYSNQPSSSFKRDVPSKSIRRNPDKNYVELCRKLGKNKLLIEEDQDISALIYQGMTRNN